MPTPYPDRVLGNVLFEQVSRERPALMSRMGVFAFALLSSSEQELSRNEE